MSLDGPRLSAIQGGRERHHDRLLSAGAAVVLLAVGGLSGFLVGLAAQPTVIALLERITR